MKKITILGLVLLELVFSPLLVRADVISPNSHLLERCAKVVNLDKFPEVVLFGSISGPMVSESNSIVFIKNNECISKGYKFNSINIHWNYKDQTVMTYNGVIPGLLIENMDVYGGYVENSNPLIKETVEYSIVKSALGDYSLEKTTIISEYNNGTPSTIITTDPIEYTGINKITKKLKLGMKNENEVKYLQRFLNRALKMSLIEDGSFGLKTKMAVIKFQKVNNLTADGIVGLKTMAVLNSMQ